MLKTDKKLYKVILIFSLIAFVIGICASILNIVLDGSDIWMKSSAFVTICAFLFAGYYILLGYTKNAARYYKAFIALMLLNFFVALGSVWSSQGINVNTVLYALVFLILLILLFIPNLGKVFSITASLVVTAICIAVAVTGYAFSDSIGLPISYLPHLTLKYIIQFILSIALLIFTVAKYIDKAIRKGE